MSARSITPASVVRLHTYVSSLITLNAVTGTTAFHVFSDSESKNLYEVAESCTVRVLYGAKRIRPDIVKIFTANKIDIFEDEFGAIYETRLKTWEFDQ